tara:strand:+ start:1353 stop:1958 length:606 start_codon:yes stop_codon:yes gene_type:complete
MKGHEKLEAPMRKVNVLKEYEKKYNLDELDELDTEDGDYQDYASYVFVDETPVGKVVMTYNADEKYFIYYCDSVVSNRLLEVVCRGFVLKYGCKEIHVNYVQEQHARKDVLAKVRSEREKEREKERENDECANSVFATFKTYNMKKNGNLRTDADILIKRNYNKFKCGGRVSDYGVKKTEDNSPNDVSYTHFKKSQKAKTN